MRLLCQNLPLLWDYLGSGPWLYFASTYTYTEKYPHHFRLFGNGCVLSKSWISHWSVWSVCMFAKKSSSALLTSLDAGNATPIRVCHPPHPVPWSTSAPQQCRVPQPGHTAHGDAVGQVQARANHQLGLQALNLAEHSGLREATRRRRCHGRLEAMGEICRRRARAGWRELPSGLGLWQSFRPQVLPKDCAQRRYAMMHVTAMGEGLSSGACSIACKGTHQWRGFSAIF